MISGKFIMALALCALVSMAAFTLKASAHTARATANQDNYGSQVIMQSAGEPRRTRPKSTSSELPVPDVVLTNDTTLTRNTVLPEGTLLLNNTLLPAGTKFSDGSVLQTSVTLQGPVELQKPITVPAGTRLLGGSAFPADTIIPGIESLG